jgi:hypothetical protein
MIIHEGSNLGAILPFFVMLGTFVLFLAASAFFVIGQFRRGAKLLGITAGAISAYILMVGVVSLFRPQTIVNVGDSYCSDLWCIGIDRVNASRGDNETVYKLDVRIFSDANSVKTSAQGASLYLFDERGRRFPLVADPSVIPIDVILDPREIVRTSLTFVTPPDVRQLFLSGDGRRPFWTKLYFASDWSLWQKPALLRVF